MLKNPNTHLYNCMQALAKLGKQFSYEIMEYDQNLDSGCLRKLRESSVSLLQNDRWV